MFDPPSDIWQNALADANAVIEYLCLYLSSCAKGGMRKDHTKIAKSSLMQTKECLIAIVMDVHPQEFVKFCTQMFKRLDEHTKYEAKACMRRCGKEDKTSAGFFEMKVIIEKWLTSENASTEVVIQTMAALFILLHTGIRPRTLASTEAYLADKRVMETAMLSRIAAAARSVEPVVLQHHRGAGGSYAIGSRPRKLALGTALPALASRHPRADHLYEDMNKAEYS